MFNNVFQKLEWKLSVSKKYPSPTPTLTWQKIVKPLGIITAFIPRQSNHELVKLSL